MSDLRDLVEQWRDEAWSYQRDGRPELRDLSKLHADQLAAVLDEEGQE